jgi:hypothetical protein
MGKGSMQEQILKASKEIAVKFIEVGRLSPGSFSETFQAIYEAIDTTVNSPLSEQPTDGPAPGGDKESA